MIAVVVRAALVALLVILIAVMPVTSSVTGAVHEIWLPGAGGGFGSMPRVRVFVHDRTGLVRTVSAVNADVVSNPGMLVVSWLGGCGDRQTDIVFYRHAQGYGVTETTYAAACALLAGYQRGIALHLWSPIDSASVQVVDGQDED